MTARQLIEIFMDTQEMIKNDPVLQQRMVQSQTGSQLYLDGYVSPVRHRKSSGKVTVIENTTFQCAREVIAAYDKVAVLNFANPHEPGGGVFRGAVAQEECLCRSSTLYNVLAQPYFSRHYYQYHYQECDYFFSDRLIYSPAVTVFKSDDKIPQVLEAPFSVDVITCAAPYLKHYAVKTDAELLSVYKSRIKNILEVSMSRNADCLILGAFGCGAFRNDPALMAKAFADVLIREQYAAYFKHVIFAIKKTGVFCPNLFAFEEAFRNGTS